MYIKGQINRLRANSDTDSESCVEKILYYERIFILNFPRKAVHNI